jgi:hypothetical protein
MDKVNKMDKAVKEKFASLDPENQRTAKIVGLFMSNWLVWMLLVIFAMQSDNSLFVDAFVAFVLSCVSAIPSAVIAGACLNLHNHFKHP